MVDFHGRTVSLQEGTQLFDRTFAVFFGLTQLETRSYVCQGLSQLLGPWGWETSHLKNDGNPYFMGAL